MIAATNEQEVYSKIDFSGLTCFVCGTTNVKRLIRLEHKEINIEAYEGLKIQMLPEQFLGAEYSASKDLTPKQENMGERIIELRIPRLEWLTKTHPMLTNQVRNLLETLWTIVVSRATQFHFPLQRTAISVFKDPTVGESKAVLRLTCQASLSQALEFWDSLEYDFRDWLNNLTAHQRTLFITKIQMRVYWL